MNCSIIYYSARKTSYCEKALKRNLPVTGLEPGGVSFAVDAGTLGNELIRAFGVCDVVFVVGGLEFGDSRSVRKILSRAASDSDISLSRRLQNDGGDDGYLLRSGRQLLVILPDEPDQIDAIFRGALTDYIKTYNLQGM